MDGWQRAYPRWRGCLRYSLGALRRCRRTLSAKLPADHYEIPSHHGRRA
ncbi:hypothetical protein XOC_1762 [Xanthomonas oryzae pv. oryzicola BLS256]|uniref:Uncharacterized protein n=1 Tax=Xanthomonas oryzae pv. oryzicola (strain BLS256) TaxID=383407 RepID=G7T9S4_XANOB|nr:hypothetical protein XOC_1762 [Xanthomonas oryzae pv. oryzicola BLS256]QEO98149.1 hypothetical protein XOCgx_3160 [Xanthomonas oryzae pv. oryzicola]